MEEEGSGEVKSGEPPSPGLLTAVGSALTRTPVYDEYTRRSQAMTLLGILLYLFDYVSDIAVAFWLRKERDSDFFMACTVCL